MSAAARQRKLSDRRRTDAGAPRMVHRERRCLIGAPRALVCRWDSIPFPHRPCVVPAFPPAHPPPQARHTHATRSHAHKDRARRRTHALFGATPALACWTKKSHMPVPGLRCSSSFVAMNTWAGVGRQRGGGGGGGGGAGRCWADN